MRIDRQAPTHEAGQARAQDAKRKPWIGSNIDGPHTQRHLCGSLTSDHCRIRPASVTRVSFTNPEPARMPGLKPTV